jgi:coenzyme F420-dependent glucose-6-phosphate dehydrogenase
VTAFGFTLSSEEHAPGELVEYGIRAEELGFDFVSISDHFHPWIAEQGHSPFVWTVLGAIAASTDRISVGVGVSCPIVRMHPAVTAHAAATTALLFDGRFFLGVGTGEALNEHVLGHRWPPPHVRRSMLEEAVGVMRELFTGETVDHHGEFYDVENARLFDAPTMSVPIIVSGFGPEAAALAGRIGDGFWGNAPDRDLVSAFEEGGGSGPRYAQLNLCWGPDAAKARATVHRVWPNAGIPGQLSQDLPTWSHFETAAELVSEERATESIPCGPAITDDLVESVQQFVDAGYDHLYFHQVGADQSGFFRYWEDELRPTLEGMRTAA